MGAGWIHKAVAERTAWPHAFVSDNVCRQNASCHLQAGYYCPLLPWLERHIHTQDLTVIGGRKVRRFGICQQQHLDYQCRLPRSSAGHRRPQSCLYCWTYRTHDTITACPQRENLFQLYDIDDKRNSTRRPQGGSTGYSIYIPTALSQVGKGRIWTYSSTHQPTPIGKQCQLISDTMGVCQIGIVTVTPFIYTMRLWCKLGSTICEKAGKKRGDNSRNTERCWWSLMGEKYITHHQTLIVSLSSLTSVKDAVIVSLPVSLVSGQTSSLSAAPSLLKQDQKQQARYPTSTLTYVLELSM